MTEDAKICPVPPGLYAFLLAISKGGRARIDRRAVLGIEYRGDVRDDTHPLVYGAGVETLEEYAAEVDDEDEVRFTILGVDYEMTGAMISLLEDVCGSAGVEPPRVDLSS